MHPRRLLRFLLLAVPLTLAPGCSSSPPDPLAEQTIPRETFVKAFVELRSAGMRSLDWQIDVEVRDSILGGMGLAEQDLLTFAELRGGDLDYMRSVWSEVDSVLRSRRGESADGRGPESFH